LVTAQPILFRRARIAGSFRIYVASGKA